MPARMSGDSSRSPYSFGWAVDDRPVGSQTMILAPMPTSLSTNTSRFSNIFSKISTVPPAWVATATRDRGQVGRGTPARARRRSSGWPGRGRPRPPGPGRGGTRRRSPSSSQVSPRRLKPASTGRRSSSITPSTASSPPVDRGQAEEAGHLDVVGADGVLAAAQRARPPRWSGGWSRCRRCGPPGRPGSRQRSWTWGSQAALPITVSPSARTAAMIGVLGGRDRRLVEEHRRPRSRPTSSSRARSKLAWTPRERKASRWVSSRRRPITSPPGGQQAVAGPGHQRRRQQHRRPDAGAQGRVQRRPAQAAGSMRTWLGPSPLHRRAGRGDQLQHGVHVQDLGDVAQHHRLVGQQRGGHDGQRGVLVPGRADGAAQRLPALDDEALHYAPSSAGRSGARPPTLPWPDLGPVKLRPTTAVRGRLVHWRFRCQVQRSATESSP